MRIALRPSSGVTQNCTQPALELSAAAWFHQVNREPRHMPLAVAGEGAAMALPPGAVGPPNPEPSAATAGSMHARREPGPCMTPLLVTLRANLAVEFVDECERSLPCLRRVGEAASCRMRVGNVRRVENPQG